MKKIWTSEKLKCAFSKMLSELGPQTAEGIEWRNTMDSELIRPEHMHRLDGDIQVPHFGGPFDKGEECFEYEMLDNFCEYPVPTKYRSMSGYTDCSEIAVARAWWTLDESDAMLVCKEHLDRVLQSEG